MVILQQNRDFSEKSKKSRFCCKMIMSYEYVFKWWDDRAWIPGMRETLRNGTVVEACDTS